MNERIILRRRGEIWPMDVKKSRFLQIIFSIGSAILYVKPSLQPLIMPTAISGEGEGANPWQLNFNYQGTADDTAYMAMEAALQFRETWNDGEIKIYIQNLALEVGEKVAQIWNTEIMFSNNAVVSALVNVRFPTNNATLAKEVQNVLFDEAGRYTYLVVYTFEEVVWARFSCQIFNQMSDYQWAAERALEVLQDIS